MVHRNPIPFDSVRYWPIRPSYSAPPIATATILAQYLNQDTGKQYVFLTNFQDLAPLPVADLYRLCWQIETFFQWIKQTSKMRRFMGPPGMPS